MLRTLHIDAAHVCYTLMLHTAATTKPYWLVQSECRLFNAQPSRRTQQEQSHVKLFSLDVKCVLHIHATRRSNNKVVESECQPYVEHPQFTSASQAEWN